MASSGAPNVAALVSAFNVSHPNSSHGPNVGLGQSRYARHGIAELSRSTRNRSRDRAPRGLSAPITVVRGQPSGPFEQTEWTEALVDINQRIATVERQLAAQSQFMSRIDTRATDHRRAFEETTEDIYKYKQYVEGVFANIGATMNAGMKKLQEEHNQSTTAQAAPSRVTPRSAASRWTTGRT